METLLVQKTINKANLTLIKNRVIWDFKTNPEMPFARFSPNANAHEAFLTNQRMFLRSGKNEIGQVLLDEQGFVLRANGEPYSVNGRKINALERNPSISKSYVPFWDIFFERDHAPLEQRKEVPLQQFNLFLNSFIKNKDDKFYKYYTKISVENKGKIHFGLSGEAPVIWGIVLGRNYEGKPVWVVPLHQNPRLTLGVYDSVNQSHIYTYFWDPAENKFYREREKEGVLFREYYIEVTEKRFFQYAGKIFYFNTKAVNGNVFRLADYKNGKYIITQGELTRPFSLQPIEIHPGNPSAFFLGDYYLKTDPPPINGEFKKGATIHWDKRDKCFYFRVLKDCYSLSEDDAQLLQVTSGEKVYPVLEDGFVISIRSKNSPEQIYNRVLRDKEWKIIHCSRKTIPSSLLGEGIKILEGMLPYKRGGWIAVGVNKKNLKVAKGLKGGLPKTASILTETIQGEVKVLYAFFKPAFSIEDRGTIELILERNNPLKNLRAKFIERHNQAAKSLGEILRGQISAKKEEGVLLYFEGRQTFPLDIVFFLDQLFISVVKSNYKDNPFLEIMARMHLAFNKISPENQNKLCQALSFAIECIELRTDVLKIFMNGLYSNSRPGTLQLLNKNPSLKEKILSEIKELQDQTASKWGK